MISFQSIYEEVQEQTEDPSASSLVIIKRAINQGAKKFGAILNREWRESSSTFTVTASQQYYQMPEDAIRITALTVEVGDVVYPLTEIVSSDEWRNLNATNDTSSIPEFFYVKGADEFGIFPIPSTTISSAGTIVYERRMRDMKEADYTTGTIDVVNGSASIAGTATVFTASMVGRYLSVTNGATDGMWYKIDSFISATSITIENNYAGATATGATYIIGELPDIPEEFHESLIDYGCYRYYLRRRDIQLSRDMKSAFDESLILCQANYSSKTSSQYIKPYRRGNIYTHSRRDQRVQ